MNIDFFFQMVPRSGNQVFQAIFAVPLPQKVLPPAMASLKDFTHTLNGYSLLLPRIRDWVFAGRCRKPR